MKAKRQYNIIFKIWREKNFNQHLAPCETCGKHGDALPDPLQRKLAAQLQDVWLADTLQLQEAALSDFMPFLRWPATSDCWMG